MGGDQVEPVGTAAREKSGLYVFGVHPAVHDGLRAACAAQVFGIDVMRKEDIPPRNLQDRLLRIAGRRRKLLAPRQPPVPGFLALRLAANVAGIYLSPGHPSTSSHVSAR